MKAEAIGRVGAGRQLMFEGNSLSSARRERETESEDRNNGGRESSHAATVRLAGENLQCSQHCEI